MSFRPAAAGLFFALLCSWPGQGQPRSGSEVLAPGAPPLTSGLADTISTAIGWLLGIPFTAEQKEHLTEIFVRDWRSGDRREIDGDLDFMRIATEVLGKPDSDREAIRREVETKIVASLRADSGSRDSAWLLAQYRAAHGQTGAGRQTVAPAESTAENSQVLTVGPVSFVPPEGWRVQERRGERATMAAETPAGACRLTVFKSFPSAGNDKADFRRAWDSFVTRPLRLPFPSGDHEHKPLAGYSGRTSCSSLEDVRGRPEFLCLTVLRAGGEAIPVVEFSTPNRRPCNEEEHRTRLFLEMVRLSPERAQPQKKLLTVADLEGEWYWSSDDNQIYVYRFGGGYAGSSTIVQGETVRIAADGSFSSSYAGSWNAAVIREQTSGSIELGIGRVRLRESDTKVTGYHLISYQQATDGTTVMKLLPDQYEPTAGNVIYYSRKWVRKPARRETSRAGEL